MILRSCRGAPLYVLAQNTWARRVFPHTYFGETPKGGIGLPRGAHLLKRSRDALSLLQSLVGLCENTHVLETPFFLGGIIKPCREQGGHP